jgi:uncharacterized membrane protein
MVNDIPSILIWWLFFFILGIISMPITFSFFRGFYDRGWAFSKIIGLLTVSYGAFLFSIIRIIPLSQGTLIGFTLLWGGINAYVYTKNKKPLNAEVIKQKRTIILSEVLFALGLIFWAFVRAHQPDINGLEKFMDYGFINTLLRSDYLPPADMWAAGLPINYYWYGHYVTALIIKVTNISAAVGYNLMLATILGLALTCAFSIVSTLIETFYNKNGTSTIKVDKRIIVIGALLSSLLLSFGGNFHTPFYVLKNGAEKYWYPDATRFIGYNPETEDKTIHEFPQYSYVVADLHGHLLNVPFVLLFIGFLLRAVINSPQSLRGMKHSFSYLAPLGFLLAVMFMTSTWDFGNYNILTGITFGYLALREKKVTLDAIFAALVPTLKVFGLGLFFALPFILNFESIAQGVDFVHAHSPLWQLAILWGFPALLALTFLIITPITKFFKLSNPDIFVLSLLTTCFILIVLPEIVYVKDIYIASHHRANTMFKLTYQSFVMSYLISGYVIVRLMNAIKNQGIKFFVFLTVVTVLTSLLIYPYFTIKSYYGNIFAKTNEYTQGPAYKGLDGETWMLATHPEEYDVVKWIRENVKGQPTILEAQGDSYTEFNVISSYSGLPTVEGWYVHEWLWRGSSEFPQKRADEVQQMYLSTDKEYTKTLLQKYNVQYVVVGNFERQKYPELDSQKWNSLGIPVFTSGTTTLYRLNN